MNDDKMIDRFRELHDGARRGKITLEYRAMSDAFLRATTDAQNSTLAPHHRRRDAPRVQRAVQVDLTWMTGRARTTTFDVGLGGFSALLPTSPGPDAEIRFSLRLPRGQHAAGAARIVGSRSRNRAVRVSFKFQELEHPEALKAYVIDELLTEFCPAMRRAAVTDWFSDLTGRALVAASPVILAQGAAS